MKTTQPNRDAISLDEYIVTHRGSVSAADLRGLQRFLPGLARKAEQARLEGREELVAQIDYLMDLVNSPLLEDVTDPLPAAWAEFGIAVQYLLKGVDLIPDFVEGIGLADDEWVVRRVLERNPELTGRGSRRTLR